MDAVAVFTLGDIFFPTRHHQIVPARPGFDLDARRPARCGLGLDERGGWRGRLPVQYDDGRALDRRIPQNAGFVAAGILALRSALLLAELRFSAVSPR